MAEDTEALLLSRDASAIQSHATPAFDRDVKVHSTPGDEDEEKVVLLPVPSPSTERLRLVGTIIKGFIGSGVLFLPKAFLQGGALFSVIIMAFCAYLTWFTIMRLVRCREVVEGSYGHIGEVACGRLGRVAVDASLVLSQAGFCCVYVAFIARNLLQLTNVNDCWLPSSWLWLLVLLQLPVFTPLVWVRKLAQFGYTNLAADALIACGLLGVLAYSFNGMASAAAGGASLKLTLFNSSDWPLFLGTAVYAFEGIGMVIPVYDSLTPRGQASFSATLSATLVGITAVYIIVGLVPYMYLDGFQHVTMQDSVTLDLPRAWWAYLIIAGYCLALVFSYPLMLFPAVKILEATLGGSILAPGTGLTWRRNVVRCGIVCTTLLVSYLGLDQLSNMVALVGCFCCTPLAFIYPCVFHLRLLPDASRLSKAVDVAIIAFGIGVFVFSTYQSINTWTLSTVNACVLTPGGGAR